MKTKSYDSNNILGSESNSEKLSCEAEVCHFRLWFPSIKRVVRERGSDSHQPWMWAPGHLDPMIRLDTARICRLGVCWEQCGFGVAKKLERHPTLYLAFGVSSAGPLLEE